MITTLFAIINTVIYAFITFSIWSDVNTLKKVTLKNKIETEAIYVQLLIWLRQSYIHREQYEDAQRIDDFINEYDKASGFTKK